MVKEFIEDKGINDEEHNKMQMWFHKNWREVISNIKLPIVVGTKFKRYVENYYGGNYCYDCVDHKIKQRNNYKKFDTWYSITKEVDKTISNKMKNNYKEKYIKEYKEIQNQLKKITKEDLKLIDLKWEEPIKNEKGYIIGFPDFELHIAFRLKINDFFRSGHIHILAEIKPYIGTKGENSLGNVMRQMKLYKDCKSTHTLIIVTKTDNKEFQEIFKSQNIEYYVKGEII